MPKDAISPLEGFVETDWAIAPASMNWKFTRADTWVEFQQEEPICMIVPQRLEMLEIMRPRISDLEREPELHEHFLRWCESCRDFNERLRNREPEAVRLGWQQYYFRGTAPHSATKPLVNVSKHRTRLSLREFL